MLGHELVEGVRSIFVCCGLISMNIMTDTERIEFAHSRAVNNKRGSRMMAKVGEYREMASREKNIERYTPCIELGVFKEHKTHRYFHIAIDLVGYAFGVAPTMVEDYPSTG